MEPKTHRGVIQLIGLHFIEEGGLSEESAALLAHLQAFRELSDYTPAADLSEKLARDEFGRAERFIAACRPLIDSL